AVVEDVFDVLRADRDFEAVVILGPLVEVTDVADLELGARRPANLCPFPGLGLVALVPTEAQGLVAALGGADGEGARAAADVDQRLAVGRDREPALEPAPPVPDRGVAVDERGRESQEAY